MGARISSVWAVATAAAGRGLTPEQADAVWARLDGQEPAVTPSGFLTQFEAAALELGFIEPGSPDVEVET